MSLPRRSYGDAPKIIAIVLIVIAVIGVGGIAFYYYFLHSPSQAASNPRGFVQVSGAVPVLFAYTYEQFSLTFHSTSFDESASLSYNTSCCVACNQACYNWYLITLPAGVYNITLTVTGSTGQTSSYAQPGSHSCGTVLVSASVSTLRYDVNCQ